MTTLALATTQRPAALRRPASNRSRAASPYAQSVANLNGGELPWWGYRAAQQRLFAFGKALGIGRRYGLRFAQSGVNYTDFSRREVVIDPLVVTDTDPAVHAALIKGAMCHEYGHVRYTTPIAGLDLTNIGLKSQLIARVSNVLEDERVDRAMMDASWGTAKYLRFRKRQLWEQLLTDLDPSSDDPFDVISAIIHVRYGWEIKGQLSAANQARFETVWPLVLRAWNAIDTATVRKYAEEIIRLLDLEQVAQDQLDSLPQIHICGAMNGRRDDSADAGPGGMTFIMVGAGGGQGQPGGQGQTCPKCAKNAQQCQGAGSQGKDCQSSGKDKGAGKSDKQDQQGQGAGSGKADENDKADDAAAGDKADDKADGDKAAGDKADGDKADGDKADGDKAAGDKQGLTDDEIEALAQAVADVMDDAEMDDVIRSEGEDLARTFPRGAGDVSDSTSPLRPAQVDDALYDAALGRSRTLVRHLQKIPPRPRSHAVEDGPRYSFRDDLRNSDRPMRKRDVPTRKRTVALGVLVDCSGSMGGAMGEVVKSALSTYLAASELNVPMAVWAFSDWRSQPAVEIVGYGTSRTVAPERIAGLAAVGGTVLAPALSAVRKEIAKVRADRRVLLVIHDGQPSDMTAAAMQVKAMERECEVVGIFLGEEADNADLAEGMRQLFDRRLIVAAGADALMPILGTFLSRLLQPPVI